MLHCLMSLKIVTLSLFNLFEKKIIRKKKIPCYAQVKIKKA